MHIPLTSEHLDTRVNALFVGEAEGGNEHSQHGDGRVVAMVTECLQWAQYHLSSILLLYTNFQTFQLLHYYYTIALILQKRRSGMKRVQREILNILKAKYSASPVILEKLNS